MRDDLQKEDENCKTLMRLGIFLKKKTNKQKLSLIDCVSSIEKMKS